MLVATQQALILRYRAAANHLCTHNMVSDQWAERFGMAYLAEHLADDLTEMFRLQDAFDDARAELSALLTDLHEIPFGDGYYRIDALGYPQYFDGPCLEGF